VYNDGPSKKLTIQMNWFKREIVKIPIFTKCMPFKRFYRITRFLIYPTILKKDNKSKLEKVTPVINYLMKSSKKFMFWGQTYQ
jgi:hypothetical protein